MKTCFPYLPPQNIAIPSEHATLEILQAAYFKGVSKVRLRREKAPFWRLYYSFGSNIIPLWNQGKYFALLPHRIYLISPDSTLYSEENPIRVGLFWMHFQIAGSFAGCRNFYHALPQSDLADLMLQEVQEKFEKNDPMDYKFSLLLTSVVSYALSQVPLPKKSQITNKLEGNDLLNIWKKMSQHPERNYTNQELATEACMSVNTFLRRFQWNFGQTPQNFLIHQRVKLAKKMLREKDATQAEIAAACGFANQFYFSRIFRKYTGWTPGNYRNACKTSPDSIVDFPQEEDKK